MVQDTKNGTVCVILLVLYPSHHLLEKIIFVSLDMYILVIEKPQIGADSTPVTLSGMEKAVTQLVHVVLYTILHTSPKPLTKQLLMTLN